MRSLRSKNRQCPTYDGHLKHLFPNCVVACLVVSLLSGCGLFSTPEPTATPTPTPIPLDEWVEEGYELLKQSDFAGAEAAFERVLEVDEGYGAAYVGLSQVHYWQTGSEDEALTQAEKAVEAAPESAEAYAMLALAQVESDAPDQAVEAGEEAVELDQKSALAHAALALAYLNDRQYGEAREAAEQAVALDPDLAEAYYALAMVYDDTADFPRARAALEEILTLEPDFAVWHLLMGHHWLQADRYDSAEASFERALELDSDSLSTILGVVSLHLDRYEYEEAEAQLERAAELAPDSSHVCTAWGYLHLYQEEYDEALEQYNEALEKDEDDLGALVGVANTYLWQQECDTAARRFQDLIDAYPRYATGQIGLARARVCEGDVNQALGTLRKAAELEPYNAWVQDGLGYAYTIQGRWEDATEAYVEALRLSPTGADVHGRLGLALWLEQESDSAEAEYELALALDPYGITSHTGLGDILLAESRPAEAQDHAEQALVLDESDDEAQLMLGAALVTQGKGSEAVDALEQVVEEDPENALARFYLGLAYRDDGEYSQAKKELETFIALSQIEEGDPTRMRIEQLVAALDQGYLLGEDKAIADLEEMLEVIDAEVSIEEGEDEAEKEGRTLVVSLDIPPGEEQQSLGMTVGVIAGATAQIISRVDPPIENGLLIRLEEWGQTKFTAEFALEDIRRFVDAITAPLDFVLSMEFSRVVADEATSVRQIQADTAEIRELDPKATVRYNTMTEDELREHLTESVDDEYQEAMDVNETILTLLGVIEPDLDLGELMIDLRSEQVAGFYDSDEEAYYVVEDEEQTAYDQMTLAHEYVHALQDQHFDLDALQEATESTDEEWALEALVEGDAVLAMLSYAEENISFFDQLESASRAAGYEGAVFESSPVFIQETELFSYIEGHDFVLSLYETGGWEAVNEAYENPPRSTEQILHPERYREGDEPQEVALPDLAAELGEGWEELDNDVLGEFGLRLVLAEYMGPVAAAQAAEGWGGDRYVLLQRGEDGSHILAMQAYWDDQDESNEFWALYEVYMRHRVDYTEDVEQLVGEVTSHLWLGEGFAVLATHGDEDRLVTIVVGPDEDTVEQVATTMLSE